jgi:hypothetical protein
MTDEEELGAVTAPMKGIRLHAPAPCRTLERHHATGDMVRACARCGRPAFGYHHPDPLRPGMVLWRCPRHRHPASVVDDPKQAPGGGIYR